MNTLDFELYRNCIVFVCGEKPIDDGEWQFYLDFVAKYLEAGRTNRSLVLAKGSLTSTQRKSLARVIAPFEKTVKSAVITESALVRGIVTALQWFSRDVFRTFAPSELDKALAFLDVSARDAKHLELIAARLQKDLEKRASSAASIPGRRRSDSAGISRTA